MSNYENIVIIAQYLFCLINNLIETKVKNIYNISLVCFCRIIDRKLYSNLKEINFDLLFIDFC